MFNYFLKITNILVFLFDYSLFNYSIGEKWSSCEDLGNIGKSMCEKNLRPFLWNEERLPITVTTFYLYFLPYYSRKHPWVISLFKIQYAFKSSFIINDAFCYTLTESRQLISRENQYIVSEGTQYTGNIDIIVNNSTNNWYIIFAKLVT